MEYYIGLDVSLKKTAVCVIKADGAVAWQGIADTHPEMIAEAVREYLKAWGNHMLQIRTRTLDGTLRTKFEQWYPGMKPAAADRVAA